MLEGLPQMDGGTAALILAGIGAIAGYSELRFKTATNTRDIEKLENRMEGIEKKHDALDTRVMEKLSNIERMVANLQGKLEKE